MLIRSGCTPHSAKSCSREQLRSEFYHLGPEIAIAERLRGGKIVLRQPDIVDCPAIDSDRSDGSRCPFRTAKQPVFDSERIRLKSQCRPSSIVIGELLKR